MSQLTGRVTSLYDRHPYIPTGTASECITGWQKIVENLSRGTSGVIVIECYPGVLLGEVTSAIQRQTPDATLMFTQHLFRSPTDIDGMVNPLLGDDPVFGLMNSIEIENFFESSRLKQAQEHCNKCDEPLIILGVGASLICPTPDLLVYADMARWELQQRQRRNQICNLGANNFQERASLKYKRAFFVDWRAADRLKRRLLKKIDYLLDTNVADEPKMITGEAFRRGLNRAVSQPFRVVPFFDPGPWGGHWMERVCELPPDGEPNHAWCFDGVPEENSLLLGFGDRRVEIPSIDVVFAHPEQLLGEEIVSRFGAEFPIRFDFLDTIGGGNLSLQVHPLTSYIREQFGMKYTQDESYYLLDAESDACVYLGLKEEIDREAMVRDLERAQDREVDFPAEQYVNVFPARKHDHFLIPAGTIHCSGKNSMVLEISATPYIFTFKLWDWGRLGLDGRPRPIHLRHGIMNIQWDRTTKWVRESLVNRVEPVNSGDGWREERTGLHELEFIETRRHWFTGTVPHDTQATVNVLNLVEGKQIVVESPARAFEPFVVNYAETFIVPAAVGAYTIRPCGPDIGHEYGTVRAQVRVRSDARDVNCLA
ncbi:MAG: class I mannose-6-phosphate isomerase [Acidobacteria bacterium]|nr:class I mannose-6-phosphate isomerase [Acidobacteriota bacterium]